ncbi:MAG: long-chain fatty acid--CoA ligase [Rubrobacter sp.]|nr:long-chain fatty acid--CoA ligase [Rubrobacter sp.]
MIRLSVELRGGNVAYGWKEAGGWRTLSYVGLWSRVKEFAAGLSAMGVGSGDRVALMSTNRLEWPISDLAIQSLGAATVPVYPTLEGEQVAHILKTSGAKVAVVEDRRLLDRVLDVRDEAPNLEYVVLVEGDVSGTDAKRFEDVSKDGEENPVEEWEEGWKEISRSDLATIIYTSGTTGLPKGAMLTHGNILANVEGIYEALPTTSEDTFLSFLPLSHVFERTSGQYYALSTGAATYYAESIDTVPENLREIKPTVMSSVPRLYEKMHARVTAMVGEGPESRQRLFNAAIEAGKQRYEYENRGEKVPLGLKIKMAIFDRVVFKKLREAVGGRSKFFVSGGAKLDGEVGRFFHAAGIKVMEGYGLTETSPVIACNRLESVRFGTVGKPLSNLEVRIGDGGEVQVKGPSVFSGYLDNPEADAEAFTEDGFFRTGDVGELEDGFLSITDRLKNLLVLSTGKNVAPQPIEAALAIAPHITQAVVLGDGRKYVSALVVPDYDAVRKSLGSGDSDESLSGSEKAKELIQKDIEEATRQFADYERPKKFELLSRELSQEEGELTPTLKVKNRVVRDRYDDEIKSLYA